MGALPSAAVRRILAEHGGGLRVAGAAINKAAEAAEEFLAGLAREAQASAVADKRKTVMDYDIERARVKLQSNP